MWFFIVSLALAHGPLPEDGDFDEFPSFRAIVIGRVDVADLSADAYRGNDVWGWVSPMGTEYALLGTDKATAIVSLADPTSPVIVGEIEHPRSIWSDIKTYGDFAYVSNETAGGVQVIDLSEIDLGIVTELPPVRASRSAHNVAVDMDSGFLYTIGHDLGHGGLLIHDLSDPSTPRLVSELGPRYVHDAHIVSITEGDWEGHQLAFLFAGTVGLQVADVTDKGSPYVISEVAYENLGYCHQGWFDKDTWLLYVNDELDEASGLVGQTTTRVFDVSDPTAPVLASTFSTGLATIDHNLHVVDGVIYEANYSSGLRIFDGRVDPLRPIEVGFVDTWPPDDDTSFNGAWGVYGGLPSGLVLVSDGASGLVVVDPSPGLTEPPAALVLHVPLMDDDVSPTVGQLIWHRSWGATHYTASLATEPTFTDPLWSLGVDGTRAPIRSAELPECSDFWWTVSAHNPHGDTIGPVRAFRTGPLGELNGDGVVDAADEGRWWGAKHRDSLIGDLDRDGDIDATDLAILRSNFGSCDD